MIVTLAQSILMAARGWKTSTSETPQFWIVPPPGKAVDFLSIGNIENNIVESVFKIKMRKTHLLLLGCVHRGQAHWWVCLHHDDADDASDGKDDDDDNLQQVMIASTLIFYLHHECQLDIYIQEHFRSFLVLWLKSYAMPTPGN